MEFVSADESLANKEKVVNSCFCALMKCPQEKKEQQQALIS